MALINCPECRKQISDKAVTCPNCGYPIQNTNAQKIAITTNLENTISNEKYEEIPCPNFPKDLRIGQAITNWTNDSAFRGLYSRSSNSIKSLPSGKAIVMLHTHGIRITVGVKSYNIHNSQIINIQKSTSGEISQANKSVIGRAVVGGLIMGPLGAIIGGLSGTGTKEKLQITQYAIINFWAITSRTPQSILIQCDKDQPVREFSRRQRKENKKNKEENRLPEDEHLFNPLSIFFLLIIIVSILIIIMS